MRQWYKHVVGIETTSSHVTKDHVGMRLVVDTSLTMSSMNQQSLVNNQRITNKTVMVLLKNKLSNILWMKRTTSNHRVIRGYVRDGSKAREQVSLYPTTNCLYKGLVDSIFSIHNEFYRT